MAIPEPFAHLSRSPFELEQQLRGRQGTDPTRTADDEFQSLNRLTLDGLQRALLLAHLRIAKVELLSETVHIPPEVAHHPLADLAISGIKLLATPFLSPVRSPNVLEASPRPGPRARSFDWPRRRWPRSRRRNLG